MLSNLYRYQAIYIYCSIDTQTQRLVYIYIKSGFVSLFGEAKPYSYIPACEVSFSQEMGVEKKKV